ncbi:alpha/beta hydrolase [Nonomuraea sp. NPDC050556]|uniref:alpha/beta hydrolase n=1 Tax=Nonomuraea sp. NPDC050556 TaxID=3364369 RepID=UPI00378A8E4D
MKIVSLSSEPRVDLLHPSSAAAPYALCFVHGGGWRSGSPAAWHAQMRHAAAKGVVSASLGYRTGERLADLMADVSSGYRRFLAHLDASGLGDLPVVLIGSSAGAHLATLLNLTGPWDSSRAPAGCVALNGPGTLKPWPDMDQDIAAAIAHLDPSLSGSPEDHVRAGAAPFLFVVVGKERFFPHEHVYALAEKLRAAGNRARVVLLPDAEHGFFYRTDTESSQAAQAEIDAFILSVSPGTMST